MSNSLVSGPVPALLQKQNEMHWESAVAILAELALQEDDVCLKIGDHLNDIEKQWNSKAKVKLAAQEASIAWSTARGRAWVAKKIPPGDPIRGMLLSYCHLRELANTDDPHAWAQQTATNGWTVAQLRAAIDEAGDKKAQQTGESCIECEQPMTEDMQVVSFRIGGGQRGRCCGTACAAAYFTDFQYEGGKEGFEV